MKLLILSLILCGAVAHSSDQQKGPEQQRLLIAPKEGEVSWYDLLLDARDSYETDSDEENAVNISKVWDDDDIIGDCSSNSYPMRISSVDVSPSQPQKGKTFSVTAVIELDEIFYEGTVHVYIKYKNMFPVVNKTYQMCDLLQAVDDPCPISPGQHSYTFSQTVPGYALSGRYVGKVKLKDSSKAELFCIWLNFVL